MFSSIDDRIGAILKKKHYSVTDWDFGNTYWSIDINQFVSPPSSLRINSTTDQLIACKASGTLDLKEGMVEAWLRFPTTSYGRSCGFIFRNQSSGGSPPSTSGYRVYINNGSKYIYCYKDTTTMGTKQEPEDPPSETWVRRRVSWWKSGGALYIRWERWDGSDWIKDFEEWIDSTPIGDGTNTNRCGVYAKVGSTGVAVWQDDTVIYKKL